MDLDLPSGLTARALDSADAAAVFDVMVDQEMHDVGSVEIELADIVGDWQRPSFDVASSTVGRLRRGSDGRRTPSTAATTGPTRRCGRRTAGSWDRDRPGPVGPGPRPVPGRRDRGDAGAAGVGGRPAARGARLPRALGVVGARRCPTAPRSSPSRCPPATPSGTPTPRATGGRCGRCVEDAFLEWSERDRQSFEDYCATTVDRPGFEPWMMRLLVDGAGEPVGACNVQLGPDTGYISQIAVRRDRRGAGPGPGSAGRCVRSGPRPRCQPGASSPPTPEPAPSASTSGSGWSSPAPGCIARSGCDGFPAYVGEPALPQGCTTGEVQERLHTQVTGPVRLGSMTILDDARPGMDDSVRPQDDLFGHVNGRWLAETEIPSDRSSWGGFAMLAEEAELHVRDIIEEAAAVSHQEPQGTVLQQIGDLWKSFMDEDRIEKLGAAPIADDLAAVQAAESHEELARFIGAFERRGGGGFFQSYVDSDDRDSDRYVVNVLQGGIGLPDESYYREEKFAEIRAAYKEHLARMFELAGLDDAARPRRPGDLPRDPARRRSLGARRDPRRAQDLQPAHLRRAPAARPQLPLADVRRRARRRRADAGRGRGAPAQLPRAPLDGHRRGRPRALEGLGADQGDPRERGVPVERLRRGELRLLRPHPRRARRSCAPGGSEASGSSRAASARRSARSTSPGTSRRRARRSWTSWSPT